MVDTASYSAKPALPTNRKFGWFFTLVFSAASAYSVWKGSDKWGLALIAVAVVFAAATVVAPAMLAPLNRLWFRFGLLLGRIVSPIVLGAVYFLLITPVAMVSRHFGRDILRIKRRKVATYWVDRVPTGPAAQSFTRQF